MPRTTKNAREVCSEPHVIELRGHVPTKKNGKRSFQGRVVTNPEVVGDLRALTLQARLKWGARPPVQKAALKATFYVRDGRGDLDGKFTTIQDVLVKARVLRNDSIARIRRTEQEAFFDENERTVIEIREAA
jgi:Holliday junction resolvase RusA-like endonuclease